LATRSGTIPLRAGVPKAARAPLAASSTEITARL
jgi:hypothetical protein